MVCRLVIAENEHWMSALTCTNIPLDAKYRAGPEAAHVCVGK